MNTETRNELKIFGLTKLANSIGIKKQFLQQFITCRPKQLRPVPIKYCIPIEQATNGLVTRKDLRPKDWQTIWPELDTSAEHPDLIEDCELPLDQINRAKALFNTGRIKKLSDAAAFFALPKPLALEVFADNLPITKERCEQFHQSLTNKRNSV
jgi:DNA-binding transcriptional regulator YdaS (Cro superfamily)